jgi:hypothetical protein
MRRTLACQRRQITVVAGLVLVAMAAHDRAAYSQSNAARTAAGHIIIQNNRTQQELRETKQELREIKEGLGIGAAHSSDSTPHPEAEALSSVVLVVFGAFLLIVAKHLIQESFAVGKYRMAGNFKKYKHASACRAVLVMCASAVGPILAAAFVFGPGSGLTAAKQYGYLWVLVPVLVVVFIWWAVVIALGQMYMSESRLKRRFEHGKTSDGASTACQP